MIARVPRFAGTIERLLVAADIRVNGSDPWDFQVRNERVFARILAHGSVGLGESYLDGDWDCGQLEEDWHNFGAYYDNTLMAWLEKFDARWPRIAARYGERFYRVWKYYLLSCAGDFRTRVIQLWQIVLAKHGVPGGYLSVR